MQGFTTCLWFENQAEEAARFYTSVFRNSRIGGITRYGDSGAKASVRPKGSRWVEATTDRKSVV